MAIKILREVVMRSTIKSHISFNQALHFDDVIAGGNCFAYTALLFTYVFVSYLREPTSPINYSALLDVLNGFGSEAKKNLNASQSSYPTRWELLNEEIAILNRNYDLNRNFKSDLDSCCKYILYHIKNFKHPSFYFIGYSDENQDFLGKVVSHAVAIYIPSPKEIHFFDSLSGLYILDVPENFTVSDLHHDLSQLIFKQNLIIKWLVNTESKTLIFRCIETSFENTLTKHQKIRHFLQSYVNNPTIQLDQTPFANFNDKKVLGFLERNIFVINKQDSKFKKLSGNEKKTQPSNELLKLSVTAIGIGFFAYSLYQTDTQNFISNVAKLHG